MSNISQVGSNYKKIQFFPKGIDPLYHCFWEIAYNGAIEDFCQELREFSEKWG